MTETENNDTDRRGITLYTDEGDPVEATLMDEGDNWINYDHCPERGFYAYTGGGKSLTLVLEGSDDEPLTLVDDLSFIQLLKRRIARHLDAGTFRPGGDES